MSDLAAQSHADLTQLLRGDTVFIDLRSPSEFAVGALPNAVNAPLLSDDERHQVGLTYKQSGQAAAIELGNKLVSGATRDARLRCWLEIAESHPQAWLYCWRGGLRSETAQNWLHAAGIEMPRVSGGFKALRALCIKTLENAPAQKPILVVAGRTGSGKTTYLNQRQDSIDLEGLANHRGSAFGARLTPQPTPVDFENTLAVSFLKHSASQLLLEDESRTIGRLALPAAWHAAMQAAPLLLLEVDQTERSANIVREYVEQPLAEGVSAEDLQQRYADSLDRIERRLGGLLKRQIRAALDAGFASGAHQDWVGMLLQQYYDPMYDHQLSSKAERILIRGDHQTLTDYLASYRPPDQTPVA